jgi:deoxycytidylate deaminase
MVPFLNIAEKVARKSSHRVFHHSAILMKGGSLIASGTNHNQTHAEVSAISKVWPNKRRGLTLISIRVTKTGLWAMAMPCLECQKVLRENGIKKVYYTTANRTMEMMKL